MKAIYARISTASQKIERQIMNKKADKFYIDTISGTVPFAERPEGKKLMRAKNINSIQVESVDRLGRNSSDVLNTIEHFTKKKIDIYIEGLGLHTLVNGKMSPTVQLAIHIVAAIAQLERETIKERTKQGIQAAKAIDAAKGINRWKGKPRGAITENAKIKEKHKLKIALLEKELAGGKSLNKACKDNDISRTTAYRLIKRGIIQK